MRYKTAIKVKHKRPRSLSDPYQDYSKGTLDTLLATSDSRLTRRDYQSLLGPFLTAGTYEEVVYFLPLAYEYLWDHDEDALDLGISIAWFISEYAEELKRDKLLDACRDRVCELLWKWVSRFEVDHYDRDACKEKGWVLDYDDIVPLKEAVCEFLCQLYDFKIHQDLVIEFFERLSGSLGGVDQAAWFLELWRAQGDMCHPPSHERITELLNSVGHLRTAYATLQDTDIVEQSKSPTYWPGLFASLKGIV